VRVVEELQGAQRDCGVPAGLRPFDQSAHQLVPLEQLVRVALLEAETALGTPVKYDAVLVIGKIFDNRGEDH
jgi:hypothetical protein